MSATHPDAQARMWHLQECAEIDRFKRELDIARALCERSSSPDNERRLTQAWNAYADHVGQPKGGHPALHQTATRT